MFQGNPVKQILAGAAMASLLGIAAPAQARGIVADQDIPDPFHRACTLDKGIHCKPYLFQGHNFYVYKNGLVTIDTPLPVTTLANITGSNGLANIKALLNGAPFVAIGLDDFTNLKMVVRLDATDPSNLGGFTLSWSFWAYDVHIPPKGKLIHEYAVFALRVDNNGPAGAIELTAGYGAQNPSWFINKYKSNAPCFVAPVCVTPWFPVVGIDVPYNSVVGSDMNGILQDFKAPQNKYVAGTNVSSSFAASSISYPSLTVAK